MLLDDALDLDDAMEAEDFLLPSLFESESVADTNRGLLLLLLKLLLRLLLRLLLEPAAELFLDPGLEERDLDLDFLGEPEPCELGDPG